MRSPKAALLVRSLSLSVVLGVMPMLAGSLAWSQVRQVVQPSPLAAAEGEEQPAEPDPPAQAGPAPRPLEPGPMPASLRPPLRFDPARMGAAPPPRRFQESLDELVRQGIVSPAERTMIRGGVVLPGLNPRAFQQACRRVALSARECRGDLALRWGMRRSLPRADGQVPEGTALGANGLPLPPLTVPVSALLAGSAGTFNLASVFRVTPRPAPLPGNGNRRLLLPIIGQAFSTSGFGWRLHPLLGIWRMHAGEDLAAPEGTPVVAALSGRVVSSGLAGGYGLAVEVEHQRPLRRTMYGHLSEIYVKAGERVRQGEVLGRVGSTGLSTGPHLHFELRQPAEGGWVAIDPGELDPGTALRGQDAMAQLMAQLLHSLERRRA